jgi:nucleoside-diphosphate-sugar epimerase
MPEIRRLIILGCGYVGREVARRAGEAGWAVEALTRNPAKAARLRDELGLRVVEGDLAASSWHDALDPADATVVNCVSGGGGGEAGYARSYRDGMRSLVAWARQGPPRVVVYTGSTSVYPQTGGEWLDDDAPTAASTPLNALLLEAEAVLREAVTEGLLPAATVLRLAGLYGPGRHHLIEQVRAREAELPGFGDYHLNLLHRDDAAAAVLLAAERALAGFH